MREILDELEALRGATTQRLEDEPLTRAAAERLLQVIVDLAVDVNAHIAVATAKSAPETGRASFLAMGHVGAIDSELAERLAPAAGLRNILVHRYTDIRTEIVAASIPTVLDGFAEYVRQIAAFVATGD